MNFTVSDRFIFFAFAFFSTWLYAYHTGDWTKIKYLANVSLLIAVLFVLRDWLREKR